MEIDVSKVEVVHNPAQKRFEMRLGDKIAMVKYILGRARLSLPIRKCQKRSRGKGLPAKSLK